MASSVQASYRSSTITLTPGICFDPIYHPSNISQDLSSPKPSANIPSPALLLTDLLPYDPAVKKKERLKDGLKEHLLLLTLAEQAIEAILSDQINQFDPLVGENACQIRAVKIALILRDNSSQFQDLLDNIKNAKKRTESILESASNFMNAGFSLKDALENNDLNVKLTEDDKFLIISFILTKTKVVHPFFKKDKPLVENASTDYKKIKEIGNVGTSFSGDLIKKLRRNLAEQSTRYVQEIATESMPENQSQLLSEQHIFVHHGLKCLPYYWATRALMLHAMNKQIPIVMLAQQVVQDQDYKIVNQTYIYYTATSKGYQKVNPAQMNPDSPAIILIGTTCRNLADLPDQKTWEAELLKQCPIELVLAYAAAHRQYPDESYEAKCAHLSDSHYEYHKAKAAEWGCSIANPAHFFLTHAFCDKIKNIEHSSYLNPDGFH